MSSRKDAVFAAADSIESQGNKATLEAVRVITGGRSHPTWVPMQEWRIQREADRAAREPAPDEIVNQFTAMAHDFCGRLPAQLHRSNWLWRRKV